MKTIKSKSVVIIPYNSAVTILLIIYKVAPTCHDAAQSNIPTTMATAFFLHELAAIGDAKQLEVLFRVHGVKDVDEKDEDTGGQTALHWAARRGHTACCDILLRNGADPSVRTHNGWSPAHCAAEIGNVSVLELLQNHGGELFGEDKFGDTPMKVARVYGHKEVVDFLQGLNAKDAEDEVEPIIENVRNNSKELDSSLPDMEHSVIVTDEKANRKPYN